MESALVFLLGLGAGITSGLFGIGGGLIIVPFLLFLGFGAHDAVMISVMQMIFSSLFGTLIHYKNQNIDLKDGIFVGMGGFFGASFSGMILNNISDIVLTSIFLCTSVLFFLQYALKIQCPNVHIAKSFWVKNTILLICGSFVGLFAISLGIGGGLLLGPILAYFLAYDSKKIASISLFFIIFASISGLNSFINAQIFTSDILYKGITVGIASMMGVFVGIKMLNNIKIKAHFKILLLIYALSITATSFSLLKKLL